MELSGVVTVLLALLVFFQLVQASALWSIAKQLSRSGREE